MNIKMAYLLGMIIGNGTIQRDSVNTTVRIRLPHKKLQTEAMQDVRIYVQASFANIERILGDYVGVRLQFNPNDKYSTIVFSKSNGDCLICEILRLVDNQLSSRVMRIPNDIFNASVEEKIAFLQGLADVTGYIRKSNYFFQKYKHRVYIEVPGNWFLVVDICNLLKQVNVPVQNIDWAHPNMRDGSLKKYNEGNALFWKKEHQIKIWAINFEVIGFGIIHKMEALHMFVEEMYSGLILEGCDPNEFCRGYYWDLPDRTKSRAMHPGESDSFIPECIRGRHYNSWKEIANDLGYGENT